MAEETTDITELVGLISMNGVVILLECFLECVGPDSMKFAESLADETVKIRVRSFLRTAFDNHITEFNL